MWDYYRIGFYCNINDYAILNQNNLVAYISIHDTEVNVVLTVLLSILSNQGLKVCKLQYHILRNNWRNEKVFLSWALHS